MYYSLDIFLQKLRNFLIIYKALDLTQALVTAPGGDKSEVKAKVQHLLTA
jgi:hypothetical protein